jgi:hypothetical protein
MLVDVAQQVDVGVSPETFLLLLLQQANSRHCINRLELALHINQPHTKINVWLVLALPRVHQVVKKVATVPAVSAMDVAGMHCAHQYYPIVCSNWLRTC